MHNVSVQICQQQINQGLLQHEALPDNYWLQNCQKHKAFSMMNCIWWYV